MDRFSRIAMASYPWCAAVTFASVMIVPSQVGAGIATAFGLLLAGLLAMLGGLSTTRIDLILRIVLASGGVTLAWFTYTSLAALNPAISFVGMLGQHNGTAILILGLTWLLAGVTCGSQKNLRLVTQVVGVAGGLFALAAFFEIARSGLMRTQGFSAGFFENSNSLGQFLAISAISAAAWALTEKRPTLRLVAWGLAMTGVAGILASSSRTGLLALIVGAGLSSIVIRIPRSEGALRWLTAFVAAAPLVFTGILIAASSGTLGASVRSAIAAFGTDRDAIWNSAVAQVSRAPLTGSGLQQFSAWIAWSVDGGTPTTDPHNAVLALLLGGGVVGLVLAGLTCTAIAFLLLRVAQRANSLPVALVATAPIALAASALVGWITPAALVAAFALAGGAVGVSMSHTPFTPESPRSSTAGRFGVVALGVAAVTAGVVTAIAIPMQLSFLTSPAPDSLARLYERWPDPAFASIALNGLVPDAAAGNPQAQTLLNELLNSSANDAGWRVDLAGSQLIAVQTLYGSDAAGFERFERIAEKGSQADPGSGLWDVLRALEADRLGLEEDAARYAKKALTFDLDVETRARIEPLAGR